MAEMKRKIFGGMRLLCAIALLGGLATTVSCSTSDESFTVTRAGDRREVNLGTAGPGKFHFEAKGFSNDFKPVAQGRNVFVYFWLYSGNNFYYKGAGEGFLYIPYQYAYTDYYCNYGKVKGRSNHPGEWPIETCYIGQDEPWDPTRWYSFDIEWDNSNISISINGVLKNRSNYGANSLNLIAGMGWPPVDASFEDGGMVGMEFRNWSFSKR